MQKFELKYKNTMKTGNCLYNEKPIVLNPNLILIFDGDAKLAAILQQCHYWINFNKQNAEMELAKINTYYDNCFWFFRTYEEWEVELFWIDLRTIKRKIKKLEDMGLLISNNFNKSKLDRTKWYTINYDKLAELEKQFEPKLKEKMLKIEKRKQKNKEYNVSNTSKHCKNSYTPDSVKLTLSPKCQLDTINSDKLTLAIQENNYKENNYIQDNNIVSLSVVDNQNLKNEMTDGQTDYTENFKIEIENNDNELNNIVVDIVNDLLASQKTITVNNKKIRINGLITELKKLDKNNLVKLIEYVAKKFESNNSDNIKNKNKYIVSIFANAVFEKGYLLNDFKNNNKNININTKKQYGKNKFVNYKQDPLDYDLLRQIELQSLKGLLD